MRLLFMGKFSTLLLFLFAITFSYAVTRLMYELGEPRAVWFFNLMGIGQ